MPPDLFPREVVGQQRRRSRSRRRRASRPSAGEGAAGLLKAWTFSRTSTGAGRRQRSCPSRARRAIVHKRPPSTAVRKMWSSHRTGEEWPRGHGDFPELIAAGAEGDGWPALRRIRRTRSARGTAAIAPPADRPPREPPRERAGRSAATTRDTRAIADLAPGELSAAILRRRQTRWSGAGGLDVRSRRGGILRPKKDPRRPRNRCPWIGPSGLPSRGRRRRRPPPARNPGSLFRRARCVRKSSKKEGTT